MSLVAILFGFPTALFSILLGLMLVYWVFVILGALDLDFLGGADDAATGAVKGAVDGLADGAVDGAAKGALEGATKGALDGAVPDADGALASLVSALNLKHVPVTIVLSLFALFGWLCSALGTQLLGSSQPLPGWLFATLILVASVIFGFVGASLGSRPFARVFRTHVATTQVELIGKIVVVSTGTVSKTFGQAMLDDGGAGLTLQIRCDPPNDLRRGDRCVLTDWNEAGGGFSVERLPDSWTLRQEAEAHADAEAASESAATDTRATKESS